MKTAFTDARRVIRPTQRSLFYTF